MPCRKKILSAIALALAAGLLFVVISPTSASTIWIEGKVTRGPWVEKYTHIEVNGVKYTITPEASIRHLYRNSSGIYLEETIPLNKLKAGIVIMLRVQGHRIFEINIQD